MPVAVLGAATAARLGVDRIWPRERIWAGGQWFYVTGILKPAVLAPEIDAAVLIGFPAAHTYLHFGGHPSTIYLRARNSQVNAVHALLAATADPEAPNEVGVSQPSAALVAQAGSWWLIRVLCGEAEFEACQVAGSPPVQRGAGPECFQPEEVEGGGHVHVVEAGLGQATVMPISALPRICRARRYAVGVSCMLMGLWVARLGAGIRCCDHRLCR